MGASDSKLVFKQGIFKLSEQKKIPADDQYWAGFWELPESAEDVFSLFSPTDIRRIRDDSFDNLETLILAVSSRLFVLRNDPVFPNLETAPESHLLNCIRILTRVLPFVFENDNLEQWENNFFWASRRQRTKRPQPQSELLFDGDTRPPLPTQQEPEFRDTKPLAEELIDTLIDLLFFADFTIPRALNTKSPVNLAIWQSGVGCVTPAGSGKAFESNRMEVLRLILTLTSKSMYTSANILPVQGIRAITYITTISNKQLVLTLLCSLLNTALKYNPATWRVPYDHVVFKDQRQIFVTYCLQLLLVLVLYPVPESNNGIPPKNYFRHFLGKLHRPQDFQFLVDGMSRILNQPLQATSSYLPGSQKSLTWAPEMIMLFWEVLQCNKRFRSFIVDTDRVHDFVVHILFYAIQYKNDASNVGIVRMCVFVLQTLSVEPSLGERLNTPFNGQDALPNSVRIPNFRGTYTDFLLMSIHTLITTTKGKLDAIYPALLAIINNIAPHVGELSVAASTRLLQLFASFSSPDFLFANETNHLLLRSLLEGFNAILENQYERNATFVYAVLKSHKRFHLVRDLSLGGAQIELERHARLRKELSDMPNFTSSPSGRIAPMEGLRSPSSVRAPSLSNVPETHEAFAIGDEEDSEDEGENGRVPTPSSTHSDSMSRISSVTESADEDVPTQLRGMSEKARGKMPAGRRTFSRHSSTASLQSLAMVPMNVNGMFEPTIAWVDTWLPELPMHTTLSIIDQITPELPPQGPSSTSSASLNAIRRVQPKGIEASPMRIHFFQWSPLSLGWYESLLWGFIFQSEIIMSKGTAAIWKGTAIKLFRVQEIAAQGPSLMAPQGAVDAVGTTLVQKFGSLNLRGSQP